MNLKKYWHDPVGSKLISAAIIALAGAVWGAYHWWSALQCAIAATWSYLLTASPIPHWLLGILILFATMFVSLIISLAVGEAPKTNDRPKFWGGFDWLSYTTDESLGLRWRWGYERDGAIQAPNPFCPHCDLQLGPDTTSQFASRVSFHCDLCGRNFFPEEHSWPSLRSLVARLIDRNIRNGTYPKAGDPKTT